MLLSLISPQKNVANFALNFAKNIGWIKNYVGKIELIIVVDHSTDNSFSILEDLFFFDDNVQVIKNNGFGKVAALNYGFELSTGNYVRFIDGDDALLENALNAVLLLDHFGGDALSSSYKIKIDNRSFPVASRYLIHNPFPVHKNFYSPPRWNWTLTKRLAHKVFPISAELPFEDLYMAIKILHKAEKVVATAEIDYVYVQHDKQTYGGLHNSSRELVNFRVTRNIKVLEHLKPDQTFQPCVDNLLHEQRMLVSKKFNLKKFVLISPRVFKLAFRIKGWLDTATYHFFKLRKHKEHLND